ncbi:unnamed protein product, partial [Meganyctiphanes norvegica]
MALVKTMAFIWNILWTILLLTTCCETGTLNITIESTTTTATTNSTTATMIPTKTSHVTLVLCQCGSGEVMDHTGQCQHWVDGTAVPMEQFPGSKQQGPHHVDTKELRVAVKEPKCQHRQIDLQEHEFILRMRGDLVVTEGYLRGLRVADYCIHHQESGNQVKVTARGCVSVPDVPRCCPLGKHMMNGECVIKTTYSLPFNPSLTTGPHGDKGLAGAFFPWEDRQEHVNKLNCTPGHVMKKVKLDGKKAYLAVLPHFLMLTWHPEGSIRQYIVPPQYCVDVSEYDNTYYAYSCQKDLETYCKNKLCTYKCCPEGKAFYMVTNNCVSRRLPYEPPFSSPPSLLTTLFGFPSCEAITNISNFQLLQDGTLIFRNDTYSFNEFCTDTIIRANSVETGALACIKGIQGTLWHEIRSQLFPVCLGLSCGFLALLLLLHAWIPKLREKEGKYQLFHAGSLLVAYSLALVLQLLVPKGYVKGEASCVAVALAMQFSFLSAFFWLNAMCFDVWRLFRNLVRNMFSPHSSVAVWKYLLYAIGGPLTISVVTIIMQFAAPKDGNIPGLVHPHIGEGRCWFRADKELLVYFYGPIAILFLLNFIFIGITYHYLKTIRGDYNTTNDPSGYTISSAETTRKYDFFSAFWQRFYLLVLVAVCWLTEILSWKIPPEELWAPTDMLNNLQGVFVCFVFLTNHNKRNLLKEKLPKLFQFSDICVKNAKIARNSINTSTRKLSKKMSSASIISNMTSFSSFSKGSISSNSLFNLKEGDASIDSPSIGIRSLSLIRKLSKPLDPNTHPATMSQNSPI